MAFTIAPSIKKMFQKDQSAAGQVEQVQAGSVKEQGKELGTEVSSGKGEVKEQGKHGDPGVCCGSCK